MSDPHKKSQSLFQVTIGLTVMLIAMVIIWVTGAEGITKDNITSHLSRFTHFITQEVAEQNREARFSHGEVYIEGWGYGKNGMIGNVSLEIAESSLLDTTRWSFSTLGVKVLPYPGVYKGVYFIFNEPINIIENSQLKSIVTASAPIRYGYGVSKGAGETRSLHSIQLPNQLIFTPAIVAGEPSAHPERTLVMYDDNPHVEAGFFTDKSRGEIDYQFNNIRVLSGDDVEIAIKSLGGKYTHSAGVDNLPRSRMQLVVDSFVLQERKGTHAPYNLEAVLEILGSQPRLDMHSLLPTFLGNADVAIETLLLTGKDFTIKVSGHLSYQPGETLPVSDVLVEIENPSHLLQNDYIPEKTRAAFSAMLRKVSGKQPEMQPRITFAVTRKKHEPLYIGGVAFDDLSNSVLREVLQSINEPPLILPPDLPTPIVLPAHKEKQSYPDQEVKK